MTRLSGSRTTEAADLTPEEANRRQVELVALTENGVSLSENVECEVVTARFDHGGTVRVKLKHLKIAKGGLVISSNGSLAYTTPRVEMGAGGNALVTVFFPDTTSLQVECCVLLFPEGTGQSLPPPTDIVSALPITTKGDLVVGDAGGTAVRFPVGADGFVLTADSAQPDGIKWAAAGAGSLVTTQVDLDFGAFPGTSEASFVGVDGGIVLTSTVIASFSLLAATATHSISDHAYAAAFIGLSVEVVLGGYIVYGRCLDKMQGLFKVNVTTSY